MTTTSTPTPKAAPTGQAPTPPRLSKIGILFADRLAHKTTSPTDPLARQAAIENALSMALHLVRTSDSPAALQSATGRAIRAASLMKQACAESRAV